MQGKPSLSLEQKEIIFRKLEPYLKKGLSVNKSCLQAQIPKSTVYDLIGEDLGFAEKIELCKNHFSVLVNDIVYNEVERISLKQRKSENLSPSDIKYIQWVATTSKLLSEEFGNPTRENINETDDEQKKLISSLVRITNDLSEVHKQNL